jgi:thiol-disulfide isomerase/thioredoxin
LRGYRLFVAAILLALAASAGRLLYDRVNAGGPARATVFAEAPGDAGGRRQRPAFTLGDLNGTRHSVGEWDGKVLLLNFWATWCPPCRIEIPELIALQEEYRDRGLEIVGIAIDDPQVTRDYVNAMHINYKTLIGEEDAIQVAVDYGNAIGALPYTVLIDREGRIAYSRQGQLDRREAEAVIVSLLKPSH